MKPKFEVGDEIKLVSRDYPECNGDAVVLKVIFPTVQVHCEFVYDLTIENPKLNSSLALCDAKIYLPARS